MACDELVLPIPPPSAHDIVPFVQQMRDAWNILRIVLKVPIHGDDVFTPGSMETCRQRGCLPEIPAEPEDNRIRSVAGDLFEPLERPVRRTVVNEDDFIRPPQRLHRAVQRIPEGRDGLFLIEQRHNDGQIQFS